MLKRIHLIFFLNYIFGCMRSFVGSSCHSRPQTLENDFRLISSLDFLIKKFFEADDRVLYECTFAVGKKTYFRFEGTRSLLIYRALFLLTIYSVNNEWVVFSLLKKRYCVITSVSKKYKTQCTFLENK